MLEFKMSKAFTLIESGSVAAFTDTTRKEKRMVHAVGDGTFIGQPQQIDRNQNDKHGGTFWLRI
jgi:hypothetical protein